MIDFPFLSRSNSLGERYHHIIVSKCIICSRIIVWTGLFLILLGSIIILGFYYSREIMVSDTILTREPIFQRSTRF